MSVNYFGVRRLENFLKLQFSSKNEKIRFLNIIGFSIFLKILNSKISQFFSFSASL